MRIHRFGPALTPRVLLVLLVLLVLAPSGCKSKETGAREAFAKQFTCPESRVEVRNRPEVKPSALIPKSEPPADVKLDAERLKMWQAEQDKTTSSIDDVCEMFEARGCGQQTLLCCMRPPKHMDRVNCSTRPYGTGVAKW